MPSTRTRLLALASGFLACAQVVRATGVPTGFVDEPVVSGLNQPTAIAFAPDGRLFICEQGGKLRVAKFDSGTGVWSLLPTPFLQLSVDSSGERGLLGVAFHPSFASNNKIYVYHTMAGNPAHNRISEYTASGDLATGGSSTPTEVVGFDIDNLTSATNHNGGAMHFGTDGKLYVAVGDNATGLAAADPVTSPPQTLDNLLGKILRLNSDLTIPTDNPFLRERHGNERLRDHRRFVPSDRHAVGVRRRLLLLRLLRLDQGVPHRRPGAGGSTDGFVRRITYTASAAPTTRTPPSR